jgi:HAD superfamily hydrolase (TIGR01509 family)
VTIRGILFDVDGTLVDSNIAHAKAWHDTFTEAGLDGGDIERLRHLIGMGGDKLLPTAVQIEKESPDGQRLAKRRSEIFKTRYLEGVQPFPDAGQLVRTLRDRGWTLGVATSAEADELRALLAKVDAEWLVERAASSKDVKASKPDPDVVHSALDRIGMPADEVALIGDTPYDIEASLRGGIKVIALRCGGWGDEDLGRATAIYDDPSDLLANLDSSPLVA